MIDAFIVAKKNQHYELKRYNTWYVYLLFVASLAICQALIDETKTNSLQSFKIPSGNMTPAMHIGDRIVAQIGYYRNHDVVRNDLIIFRYPAELDKPMDEKTHYVSRCVGIPGDTLSLRNKQLYINSLPSIIPAELQHTFKCFTNNILSENIKKKYNIQTKDNLGELLSFENKTLYLIDLTQSSVDELRKTDIFDSIVDFQLKELDQNTMMFPYAHKSQYWTPDDYGPLWIPKSGVTIKLDSNIVEMYVQTIKNYEGHTSVEAAGDKLNINGTPVSEYTFKQNYYFTMGDNRHGSADSRYWGFVPEDHLVGKAWLVFYSYDPDLSFPDNFRKERFFMPVK